MAVKILFQGLSPRQERHLAHRGDPQAQGKHACRDAPVRLDRGVGRDDEELVLLLARHDPDVIHTATHGLEREGLMLRDSVPLSAQALLPILATSRNRLRCVFLNACHSAELARAAAGLAECAIGFPGPLEDERAIRFAEVFYGMLALACSVAEAYVGATGHAVSRDTRAMRDVGARAGSPRDGSSGFTRARTGRRIELGLAERFAMTSQT